MAASTGVFSSVIGSSHSVELIAERSGVAVPGTPVVGLAVPPPLLVGTAGHEARVLETGPDGPNLGDDEFVENVVVDAGDLHPLERTDALHPLPGAPVGQPEGQLHPL